MKLLNTLFTEEELKSFENKNIQDEEDRKAYELLWAEWLKKNEKLAIGYITVQKMFKMIKQINSDDIITIKGTKSNLNSIIHFSTSKHNEFKKSNYVQYCYDAINKANSFEPFKSVMKTTTGSFSEGAFGHNKNGKSQFHSKFITSTSYEMKIPFGLPFLILDNCKIVLFEGFDYQPIEIDHRLISKYQDYLNGRKRFEVPF